MRSEPVAETYRSRRDQRAAVVADHDRRHAHLAWWRGGIAAAAVGLIVWLGRPGLPWLVVPGLAFVAVAIRHAFVLNARDRALRAVAFCDRGLRRLDGTWPGTGETGLRFRSDHHPYADDLDLFGSGSLFELLSTPRTTAGETTLAAWLLNPATPEVVRQRQRAVQELSPRLDLREGLFVFGPEVRETVDTDALGTWAVAPRRLVSGWPRYVLPVLAALTTAHVGWWIWSGEPPRWLGTLLIAQSALGWWFRGRVRDVSEHVERRAQELGVLRDLLAVIEREPASSPMLQRLTAELTATGHTPSVEIGRLVRLADLLNTRQNQFFVPIAALLLLGTQTAMAIDRWRERCGPHVSRWIEIGGEYEALAALAGYAAEHASDPYPAIEDGAPILEADALSHPLIPAGRAVPNDVRLGGAAPHLLLISGSNMSGKSTWLRTIGINVVLAQTGAPVRARAMRLSPLQVGATLRIQDSLQAGQSRFFAEITRLSEIVAMARRHAAAAAPMSSADPSAPPAAVPAPSAALSVSSAASLPASAALSASSAAPLPASAPSAALSASSAAPLPASAPSATLSAAPRPASAALSASSAAPLPPSASSAAVTQSSAALSAAPSAAVLFLLDEMLAGTNSHDRRIGAEAVAAGLVDLGAIGLMTTHDLALTELVARLGGRAANVHFEDRFEGGVLHFDYRLRPGVVQTSNALALMRSVGLDIGSE